MAKKARLDTEQKFLTLIKEGALIVTPNGDVLNTKTGRTLAGKHTSDSRGYRKVNYMDKETKEIMQVQLHRLVWVAENGPITDPSLVINHKDGVRSNCDIYQE